MLICGRSAELGRGMASLSSDGSSTGSTGQRNVASLEPSSDGTVKLRVHAEHYPALLNNVALQSGNISTVRDGDEITLRGRRTCSFVFKRLRRPTSAADGADDTAAPVDVNSPTDGVIDIDGDSSKEKLASGEEPNDEQEQQQQKYQKQQGEESAQGDEEECQNQHKQHTGGKEEHHNEAAFTDTGKRRHNETAETDLENRNGTGEPPAKSTRLAAWKSAQERKARRVRHAQASAAAAAAESRRNKRSALRRERGTSTAAALVGKNESSSLARDTSMSSSAAQMARKRRELVVSTTRASELGEIDMESKFPYSYISPAVRDVLRSTAKMHLCGNADGMSAAETAAKVGAGSNRISLWGPQGSEKFMESMSRALAAETGSDFIVVEHHDLHNNESARGKGEQQQSAREKDYDGVELKAGDDEDQQEKPDEHGSDAAAANTTGGGADDINGLQDHDSGEKAEQDATMMDGKRDGSRGNDGVDAAVRNDESKIDEANAKDCVDGKSKDVDGPPAQSGLQEAMQKSIPRSEHSPMDEDEEEDDEHAQPVGLMDEDEEELGGGARDHGAKDEGGEDTLNLDKDIDSPPLPRSLTGRRRVGLAGENEEVSGEAASDASGSKGNNDAFQMGDRVLYIGNGRAAALSRLAGNEERSRTSRGILDPSGNDDIEDGERGTGSSNKGPSFGAKGTVAVVFEENKRYVGVTFDRSFPGANNLGGECEQSHGLLVESSHLRKDRGISGKLHGREEANIDQIFAAVNASAERDTPAIVHIRQADKAITGCTERAVRFQTAKTPSKSHVLFVAATTLGSAKGDGSGEGKGSVPRSLMMPGASPGLVDIGMFDNVRGEERSRDTMRVNKICRIFPNKVNVYAPKEGKQSKDWQKDMETDAATERRETNRRMLQRVLAKCEVVCTQINEIDADGEELTEEWAERVVANAIAVGGLWKEDGDQQKGERHEQEHVAEGSAEPPQQQSAEEAQQAQQELNQKRDTHGTKSMQSDKQPSATKKERIVVSKESVEKGLERVRKQQKESQSTKLDESKADNEFEKRLLSEVVPPGEVGVRMNDVGALENVKKTLEEVVMLPMRRPELFQRGALAKQTKGLLLFGPPGTGKTMLAKAVATESGANFLHVPLSAIASKWFGEGEKSVRAVFSLAQKISPSVVFVDEVDSLLGKREKAGEHEAMRKMKNEFMSAWDGLRSSDSDRVLVMAATNRPFDLDEAVIRRLPRRVMVDLPDKEARKQILKALLMKEVLSEDFDYDTVAEKTSEFSGSDLKNLCVAASFRPVRDHLKLSEEELAAKELRPITTEDLVAARNEVGPSLSNDSTSSMSELKQFNEQFGEGGSRATTQLSYFL